MWRYGKLVQIISNDFTEEEMKANDFNLVVEAENLDIQPFYLINPIIKKEKREEIEKNNENINKEKLGSEMKEDNSSRPILKEISQNQS